MAPLPCSTIPAFNDGLYLGVNAVPDSCLVVDCPVGCFFKCERIALNHDITSTLYDPLGLHRIVQSGVDSSELPLGTEALLAGRVRDAVARLRPAMVFLTEVSMTQMASNDLPGLAEQLEQELDVPVVAIAPDPFGGDFLDGYERFLAALVSRLVPTDSRGPTDSPSLDAAARPEAAGSVPRDAAGRQADRVVLVGYFPDRLEEDHRANVTELRRLVEALGVECAGVVCGGGAVSELREACRANVVVSLPHGRAAAKMLADRIGARLVEAELPVGLEATAGWVEQVALALDRRAEARAFLEAEMRRVLPMVARARNRFLVDRVAVVAADPAWAVGLLGLLAELGMQVPLVAARTRHASRLGPLRAQLERLEIEAELLWDFDAATLRHAVERVEERTPCDVIIGSSSERSLAHGLGAGFVELGYPCYMTHAFSPRPSIGFCGVARLLDELANAAPLRGYHRAAGGAVRVPPNR